MYIVELFQQSLAIEFRINKILTRISIFFIRAFPKIFILTNDAMLSLKLKFVLLMIATFTFQNNIYSIVDAIEAAEEYSFLGINDIPCGSDSTKNITFESNERCRVSHKIGRTLLRNFQYD